MKAACTMLSLIFQLRKVIAMKKYNGKELYKGLLFIKSMMSMNNEMCIRDRTSAEQPVQGLAALESVIPVW